MRLRFSVLTPFASENRRSIRAEAACTFLICNDKQNIYNGKQTQLCTALRTVSKTALEAGTRAPSVSKNPLNSFRY